MKKILLLMFIMGAFSPLINAYEYLFYNNTNASSTLAREQFFIDENNNLVILNYRANGSTAIYRNDLNFYSPLNAIKISYNYYISNSDFQNILKNDLNFLNDFYTQRLNPFLNYLYNEQDFTQINYIQYDNYELLYNSDGLVVESIVNGIWAGLYSDSEKGVSGYLYSSGGQLIYVNGKPINWMESQMIMLMDMVSDSLREIVAVLGSMVPYIVAAVLVLLILYYVVSVGKRAIMPSNVKVRKRFLGSHNDEC